MSETEAEATPLDDLKALVQQIEARKREIAAADELPKLAKLHAESMIEQLSTPSMFDFGRVLGWPDYIKANASAAMQTLKADLIDKATVERERRVLVLSLEINDLALKIDKIGHEVARSLIVTVPPANEG